MAIRKILVPVDFSPASLSALDRAIDLARQTGASVVVLHVLETVALAAPADLFGATATLGTLEQEQRRIAQHELRRLEARLRNRHTSVRTALIDGSPAAAIASAARRLKAGLIVMATHGRSGLSHLLLGSVAEKVIRTAECPVLTIPIGRDRGGARARGRTARRRATRRSRR